jgi:anti-sigma factor RsiW
LNCRDAIHEISSFLDGELDAGLKAHLEQHFAECDDCRLIMVQTKKTIEIFVNDEPVELPAEVRSRLHGALRKRLSPPV